MIYKRKTYRLQPNQTSLFNHIFDEYVLPSHIKHGAQLVGRWIVENDGSICEIWAYPSDQAYNEIQKRIRKDPAFQRAETLLQSVQSLNSVCDEDDLRCIRSYSRQQHSVSVSGFIRNAEGKVLLVKTVWREDTWEMPGGAVDEGETVDVALHREIAEETGIKVDLLGISGVYSNGSVISIVFTGTYKEGELRPSAETPFVEFIQLDESNFARYITRAKYKSRVLDAMKGFCSPYEAFKVRPYEPLRRYLPSQT